MTYPVLGREPQRAVRMLEAPLTVGAADPATRELEAVGWVSSNYVTGFTYRWDGFRAPSLAATGFASTDIRCGPRPAA